MIKPNEYDFEKYFPKPEHLKDRADLLELNADIDQIIRMIHRSKGKQAKDPEMIEILHYIDAINSKTQDFSRLFAERLKIFGENISIQAKRDQKSFKAIGSICFEFKLITGEDYCEICGDKLINLNQKLLESEGKSHPDTHSGEDKKIELQKSDLSNKLARNSNLDEVSGKRDDVSSGSERESINTAYPQRNVGTEGSELSLHENSKRSSEPVIQKTVLTSSEIRPKQLPEQNLESTDMHRVPDRDTDEITIKNSVVTSEVNTEMENKVKRRSRREKETPKNDPFLIDQEETKQEQVKKAESEELKQSLDTRSRQNSVISSQISENGLKLWDNYKLSSLPKITAKTKEAASAAMLKLLSDHYEKSETASTKIRKVKTLEDKALKYCFEESIINGAQISHYGQRLGPTAFERANYNISIDGELKLDSLIDGMNALYNRFKKLADTYPTNFKCKLDLCCRFGVPKLLFRYEQISTTLLFTINDEIGKASSNLISAYRKFHPLADDMLMTIKLWSSLHQISDDKSGYLSPFAWENLVILFLQVIKPKILPSFQKQLTSNQKRTVKIVNNSYELIDVKCNFAFENPKNFSDAPEDPTAKQSTLFDLVGKFFRFYTEKDHSEFTVSIKYGALRKAQPQARNYLFSIEDPFVPDFDLGSSCLRNSPQADIIIAKMKDAIAKLTNAELTWIQP